MVAKINVHQYILRSFMSLVGVVIQSFGAALLLESNLGMDPYSAVNIGFSKIFHWELGPYQLVVNLLILVLVFIFQKKLIGPGTIFNMVLVGYGIQLFSFLYERVLPIPDSIGVKIVVAIVGLLIFTFGASMYISADVGVAPYDALTPIFLELLHSENYRRIRIIQDTAFMIVSLLARGPFGLVTLIVAFGTGPFIIFWREKVFQGLLNWIKTVS